MREFVINNDNSRITTRDSTLENIINDDEFNDLPYSSYYHKNRITIEKKKLRNYLSYQNLLKLVICSILFGLYAYTTGNAHATQNYVARSDEKIHVLVSSKELNTINFGLIPVTNIIGDEEKYKVIDDDSHLNLFFKLGPNISIGESIELSITNSAHKIFHLILHVKDIEGQLIFIKDPDLQKTYKQAKEREIADLIRVMVKDKNTQGNKYFISKINRKILLPRNSVNSSLNNIVNQESYEIIQDRIYSYKDLVGARLVVTNKDKKIPIILENSDFDGIFDHTLATTIEHNTLMPESRSIHHNNAKSKSYVFIIAENKE